MNKKYTPITPAQAFAALAISCPTKERYRFHNTEDDLGQEGHLTGASGVGGYPFFDTNRNSWALCALVTFESPIAKGHNPQNLTEEQVGEGYRLLTKEEHDAKRSHPDTQYYEGVWVGWSGTDEWWTNAEALRTQKPAGYFLPKVPQYVPWTFETAPKGCVLVRGKNVEATRFVQIIASWSDSGVTLQYGGGRNSYEETFRLYEFSVDGKTWAPAGTKVDV